MTYQVHIDGSGVFDEAWDDIEHAKEFARNYNFFHRGTTTATVRSWNPRTEQWVSVR